jgi:hypothetical protein
LNAGPARRSADELLAAFADASDALFDSRITRSDSFAGDIGEFVASRTLGLDLAPKQTAVYDAMRGGLRYQIKTATDDDPRAPIPLVHLLPGFDVLVGVRLSRRFQPFEVIAIKAGQLPDGVRRIDERLLATVPSDRFTTFPPTVSDVAPTIERFGGAFMALIENGVVRTRHIVGDIGAQLAADLLDLRLALDSTNKGFDAIDDSGVKYEIKTRRVYSSGRRTSETRRINGLVGKSADVLVVVQLDRGFRCAALWTMPLANVANPKSANMRNILLTPGIQQVV